MFKYYISLCISRRVDPLSLEKAMNGSFAKWISSNMFGITYTLQITTRRNIVKRPSKAQQKSDRKSKIACACRRSELMEKSSSSTGFIGHADSSKCRRRCHDISDVTTRIVSCIGRENIKKKRIKFRILLSHLCFSYLALYSSHGDMYCGDKGKRKMR